MWHGLEHGISEGLAFVAAALSLFLLNRLGFISRKSSALKVSSFLVVILLDAVFLIAWTTTPESPFALSLDVTEAHQISKVEISKSPIRLSLHRDRVERDHIFYRDDQDHQFFASLPDPLPIGRSEVVLEPASTLFGRTAWSWQTGGDAYLIKHVDGRWLAITNVDFLLVFLFIPGSVAIWYGGTRGKDPPEIEE
jgi:hypothetical protein